jgi:hypothetical protein
LQAVANVGLAIGLVGGVAGATLLLASSKSDTQTVAAAPRAGGGYVSYRLRF